MFTWFSGIAAVITAVIAVKMRKHHHGFSTMLFVAAAIDAFVAIAMIWLENK